MIEEARGELRRAAQSYQQALDLAMVDDRPLPAASYAYVCLGRLHYEWNDLPTAADELRQAVDLASQGHLHQVVAEASMELAPVLVAQGATDDVDVVLHQARDAALRWNDADLIARTSAAEARVRLLQGQTAAADRWVGEARIDLDDLVEVEGAHLTFARLLLVRGQLADARSLLHGLAAHAEQRGQLRAALEAFVLLAIAQHAVGDERGALAILERALLLAEPDGYVRTFLDAGPAILIMLEVGLGRSEWGRGNGDHRGVRSYARTLLEHLPRRPAPAVPSTPAAVNLPPGVEPLTVRELDVLRLIAAGKSNGEIAETLVVAVSTVKAHINNIFGKLGVTSRTQALARARDFQLL